MSKKRPDDSEPPRPAVSHAPSAWRSSLSGWVRWWGLIAFILVVLLIGAVWFVVMDRVVKHVIEDTGTKIVGAKVEVAKAHLSLSPLGIVMDSLQITDPDAPMTNSVEVKLIVFALDGPSLLRRKIVTDEMILDGVRFKTPRQTSGAVPAQAAAHQPSVLQQTAASLPSFRVPDVKEILANEELHSLKLVEELRANMQAEKERWQKQLAELPDKTKLADYKKRLESVQSAGKGGLSGMVGGASDALAIQKEISQDLERLTSAKKSFDENAGVLRKKLEDVTKISDADFQRLKMTYALSPESLANLSHLLIEGPIGARIQKTLQWYQRLNPYLQSEEQRPDKRTIRAVTPLRGKGTDVQFRDFSHTPNFLIRIAKLKLDLEVGTIGGVVQNITTDQPTLGLPLSFRFAGGNLNGLKSVSISGEINRLTPQPRDAVLVTVQGYHMQNVALLEQPDFPVSLKAGDADLKSRVDMFWPNWNGTVSAKLTALNLDVTSNTGSPSAKAVASALSNIKEATVKAELGGTMQSFGMAITTDIDQALIRAASKQMKDQADKIEKALRAEVAAKVDKPLADLKGNFSQLMGVGDELTARIQQAGGLTKSGSGGLKLPF